MTSELQSADLQTRVRSLPVGAPIPPPTHAHALTRMFTARVLLTLAVVIAWVLLYLLVLSRLDEAHSQRGLYARLRTELAQGLTPISTPITTGTPVALIDAAQAGLHSVVVVEGTGAQQLQDGPGHLRSSVLPGQPGTSTLFGRSLSFGAPFGKLHTLREGDIITVTTGEGRFTFRVLDQRHKGDSIPPLTAGASRLELATASGSGAFGSLSASDALYVDADLVSKAAPAATAAPAALDSGESAMASDTSALTLAELVLTLQLLIAIVLAIFWAHARWSARAVWVSGAPLVVASLWLVSTVAARMLPNLM
jgi:sortase A